MTVKNNTACYIVGISFISQLC